MGGKPTLTRKGYAVRDAEVRISRKGTKCVLVKVRLAVEDPARFVDVLVTGRRDPLDRERAAGVRQGRRRGRSRASGGGKPKASKPDPAGGPDVPTEDDIPF